MKHFLLEFIENSLTINTFFFEKTKQTHTQCPSVCHSAVIDMSTMNRKVGVGGGGSLGTAGELGAGAHYGTISLLDMAGKLVLNAVDVSATLPEVADTTIHYAPSLTRPI